MTIENIDDITEAQPAAYAVKQRRTEELQKARKEAEQRPTVGDLPFLAALAGLVDPLLLAVAQLEERVTQLEG